MEFIRTVIDFANDHGLSTIVLLALAQLGLGVAVAIKDKVFQLTRIGDIFTKVGPMIIGYLVCDLLIKQPELTASVLAVVLAQITGDILKNLAALYPSLGSILPESLFAPKSE